MSSLLDRVSARLRDLLAGRGVYVILAIFILAFLVYGTLYVRANPQFHGPRGDGVYYEKLVKQLLTKGVYGYKTDGQPNAVVTPGYPMFLAAVYKATGYGEKPGGPYALLFGIQMLFGCVSIVLTYLIGNELIGRKAGLIAAGLVAAYPPMFVAASEVLTEPIAMMTFLAFVYTELLAMRKRSKVLSLLAGVLLAVLVMTRPAFLFVGAVPVLYAFLHSDFKSAAVRAGLVAAGFALVLSPWVVRNAVTLHHPYLLSQSGREGDPLLAGVDPYYYERGDQYKYAGPSYKRYFTATVETPEGPKPLATTIGRKEYGMQVLKDELRRWPVTTLEWFTTGKMRAMFGRLWDAGDHTTLTIAWFDQFAIVGLGMAGLLALFRQRRLRVIGLMLLVGVGSLLPFVPEPRFVFSFMPLLALFAANAAVRIASGAAAEPALTAEERAAREAA